MLIRPTDHVRRLPTFEMPNMLIQGVGDESSVPDYELVPVPGPVSARSVDIKAAEPGKALALCPERWPQFGFAYPGWHGDGGLAG